jgi:hypothetical protein
MNVVVMQALDLLLLTFAAFVIGYKLGHRARQVRPPLKIGSRLLWMKRTAKGNFKPVQGFVMLVIGDWVRIVARDDSRAWVRRDRIARR